MTDIQHPEMVRVLAKSGDVIASELTGNTAHVLHMAIGISGEAAELLEAYDNALSYGRELDCANILEELGDLEFYIEGFRQGIEVSREEVLAIDVNELELFGAHVKLSAPILSIKLNIVAGRLLDLTKKAVVYQKPVDGNDFLNILADLECVLERIRTAELLGHEATLEANIEKLGERYKGFVYSDKAAQERADKVA